MAERADEDNVDHVFMCVCVRACVRGYTTFPVNEMLKRLGLSLDIGNERFALTSACANSMCETHTAYQSRERFS